MVRVTDTRNFGEYKVYQFEADEEKDIDNMPTNNADGKCDYGNRIGTGSTFVLMKDDGTFDIYKFKESSNSWVKVAN